MELVDGGNGKVPDMAELDLHYGSLRVEDEWKGTSSWRS